MKETFLRKKLFRYLLYIFPGIVVYYLLPWLEMVEGETLLDMTQRICESYIIGCILFAINSFLTLKRSRSMRGLMQVLQIILFFVGSILIVSVLINKSPVTLFAGLGASAAVLMLVFKDSILGFVAGIQLSVNDMLRIGDWIQLSDGKTNGIVQEITLNTVKIQNWDNTISTVPPYTLVTTTFRNWRGMQESGGRRVDKCIKLDLSTLDFCSPKLWEHIRTHVPLLEDYRPSENEIPTNAQLYRMYIGRYLGTHPEVNQDMDLIVSQKEPTEYGLPIEVYFFLRNKVWKDYECIQSDIFDHLLAMVKEFQLKLYQYSV